MRCCQFAGEPGDASTVINKIVDSFDAALAGLADGMTVLIGGFTDGGAPIELVEAVMTTGAKDLTVVANGAGAGEKGLALLIRNRRVRKVICSFPTGSVAAREAIEAGHLELEVSPQGTMVERMRAAGAGLGGVLTPTGLGTEFAAGKPIYELDGRQFVVERPIHADFALIRAWKADRWGNLVYRYAQQNFNPAMAMAAACTVVQVDNLEGPDGVEPMQVHTPGIFVKRVLHVDRGAAK